METIFDIAGKRMRIAELEARTASSELWDDPEEAQSLLRELSQLRDSIQPIIELSTRVRDLVDLAELAMEESEEAQKELEVSLAADLRTAQQTAERLELQMLLSRPHDASNAIVEINAGAGGTESCDWAQMLLRMYLRWAQEHNYATEIVDETPGEVTGYKSVTFEVSGPYAYGYLKGERGVHRLVRISPFDANKRRHTSFASVDVIPVVEEVDEVQISPDDLKIDTYRASGAGGQHVNKTDSAVRITHLPTGIVVSCQNERSQHKNRAMAMKVLQARLLDRERRANEARISELRGEQQSIEWGNQIRSYTFQPYTLIKDHRTGCEVGDVIGTMNGNIDPFLEAYLRWANRTDVGLSDKV